MSRVVSLGAGLSFCVLVQVCCVECGLLSPAVSCVLVRPPVESEWLLAIWMSQAEGEGQEGAREGNAAQCRRIKHVVVANEAVLSTHSVPIK